MFDLGWSEMGLVLLVALLILGPKELPKLARDLGRWVGKARSLSREFQRSLEDMAREAELDDVKKQLESAGRELRNPQIGKRLERELDPDGEMRDAFNVDKPSKTKAAAKPAAATGSGNAVSSTPSAADASEAAPAPQGEVDADRAPAAQSADR